MSMAAKSTRASHKKKNKLLPECEPRHYKRLKANDSWEEISVECLLKRKQPIFLKDPFCSDKVGELLTHFMIEYLVDTMGLGFMKEDIPYTAADIMQFAAAFLDLPCSINFIRELSSFLELSPGIDASEKKGYIKEIENMKGFKKAVPCVSGYQPAPFRCYTSAREDIHLPYIFDAEEAEAFEPVSASLFANFLGDYLFHECAAAAGGGGQPAWLAAVRTLANEPAARTFLGRAARLARSRAAAWPRADPGGGGGRPPAAAAAAATRQGAGDGHPPPSGKTCAAAGGGDGPGPKFGRPGAAEPALYHEKHADRCEGMANPRRAPRSDPGTAARGPPPPPPPGPRVPDSNGGGGGSGAAADDSSRTARGRRRARRQGAAVDAAAARGKVCAAPDCAATHPRFGRPGEAAPALYCRQHAEGRGGLVNLRRPAGTFRSGGGPGGDRVARRAAPVGRSGAGDAADTATPPGLLGEGVQFNLAAFRAGGGKLSQLAEMLDENEGEEEGEGSSSHGVLI